MDRCIRDGDIRTGDHSFPVLRDRKKKKNEDAHLEGNSRTLAHEGALEH